MELSHSEGEGKANDNAGNGDGSWPVPPAAPVPLGNNIFLVEPSIQPGAHENSGGDGIEPRSRSPPPSLIILCTWLGGATTPRVTKFVEGYQKKFPSATLVLVRTVFADLSARSFASIRSRLRPARDAIIAALRRHQPVTASGSKPHALLHIFSHGGCNMALQLAQSISDEAGPLLTDHLRQIVFDCCPGDTSFDKAFNAAIVSLPPTVPPPLRTLGTAAVFAAVASVTALQKTGLMSSVDDMRRQLNEPSPFGPGARRLYLFSRADRTVAPADVRSHARLAREVGYDVGLVIFGRAAHCALVTEDAAGYWRHIRRCWTEGLLPQLGGEVKL